MKDENLRNYQSTIIIPSQCALCPLRPHSSESDFAEIRKIRDKTRPIFDENCLIRDENCLIRHKVHDILEFIGIFNGRLKSKFFSLFLKAKHVHLT